MLAKVGELVLPGLERSGPVEAWIIDDTGLPKKGRHWVGVTRQYCGRLGKQDNCPVAVTLAPATHDASLPVAYRRYLAEDWAQDDARRHKAQIPQTSAVQTKPEIALEQINAAQTAGLPQGILPQGMGLMDAGDGHDPRFRTEITALGMSCVARVARLPPSRHTLHRRLRFLDRRTRRHSPLRTRFLSAALAICHSRGLPTQRRRRSDPNGTSPTRSQQSEGASSSRSPRPFRDVLAAIRPSGRRQEFPITDAVRLSACPEIVESTVDRVRYGFTT